jgi:hypothetical protein
MKKRTIPHHLYVEPTRRDVQERFKELGFDKTYSYDLVRDIANAMSHVQNGGKVTDAMTNVSDWVLPSDYKSEREYQRALSYHENVQRFISSLDFDKFSGNTPLAKAASVVAALSSQEGGQGSEGDGQPLPIFRGSSESMEEKAKKLEEAVDQTVEANKSLARYIINPDESSPEVALATLNSENRDLLAKLALLGDRGKIRSQRTSPTNKLAQMSEYSQVGRVNGMSNVLLPTFGYKFATKQLVVREPEQSTRQTLVLLIDNSGSMDETDKLSWVKAIVVDRLDAVSRGEAELYIGWFECSLDEENIVKIANKKEAIAFLQEGFLGNFNGGKTDVQRAVEQVCEGIKLGRLGNYSLNGVKPQIVVMNDGQDFVDSNYKPSVVTHGFILGRDNDGMKSMIANCGGHYERFL